MPDITMCEGGECPQRKTCWRFTAIPSEYMQSYFVTPPFKGGKCEYYWATDQARRLSVHKRLMVSDGLGEVGE